MIKTWKISISKSLGCSRVDIKTDKEISCCYLSLVAVGSKQQKQQLVVASSQQLAFFRIILFFHQHFYHCYYLLKGKFVWTFCLFVLVYREVALENSCNAAELRPLSYKPPPQDPDICVLCHTEPGHVRPLSYGTRWLASSAIKERKFASSVIQDPDACVHCQTGFPNIYKAFVLEVQSDEKLNFDAYIYP